MPTGAVAGSENDSRCAVIDVTVSGRPGVVLVDPGLGAECRVNIGGTSAAAGNVLAGEGDRTTHPTFVLMVCGD